MRMTALLTSAVLVAALPWAAQAADSPATPPAAQPSTQPASFTKAQIDALTSPIALFPDTLVTQILYAAAHPGDIPQALKWTQDHPSATDAEVDQQAWHPSIKALVRVPTVLKTMNDSPAWTQDLGIAFTSQRNDVMASIKQQRALAQAAVAQVPVAPAATPAPPVQPLDVSTGPRIYVAPPAGVDLQQVTPVYQPAFVGSTYSYPFDYVVSPVPNVVIIGGGGGGYGGPTIVHNNVIGGAVPQPPSAPRRITSTSQSSFGYNPAVANSRRGNVSPFVISPAAPAVNGQNNVGTQAGLSGSLASPPSGRRGR